MAARKVSTLLLALKRARKRDAGLRAKLHQAAAEAGDSTLPRRLEDLKAKCVQSEQKLGDIMRALEAQGVGVAARGGHMVIVDAAEVRDATHQGRERADLARRDRAELAVKRREALRKAADEEYAAHRNAAEGRRFKLGDVYEAVAKKHGVSPATVRRACRKLTCGHQN